MSDLLQTIEIESRPNPTAAVIWLHRLGADGNDFAPIVPELDLGGAPAIVRAGCGGACSCCRR